MNVRRVAVRNALALALVLGLTSCGGEPASAPVPTPADTRLAALIEALLDRDHHAARHAALKELASLGPEVVPPLVAVLEREDTDVITAALAADALAEFGTEAAPAAAALTRWLIQGGGCSSACSRALAGLGKAGVPGLIHGLGSPDKWGRFCSADALRKVGPPAAPAVDALIPTLDDEDDEVRLMAARALGAVGTAARRAVPRLLASAQDDESEVRYAAVSALGAVGEGRDDVITVLTGAMRNDLDWGVRRAAVDALDKSVRNRKRAIDLMREALRLSGMRPTAIHGLLRRGVDEEDLVDETVKAAAARGPKAWLTAADFLRQSGPNGRAAARALFVKTLEWSPEAEQRIRAAQALGELGAEARGTVGVLEVHADPAAEEAEVADAARAAIQAIRSR